MIQAELSPSATATSPSYLQRVAAGEPGAVEACIERYHVLVGSLARRKASDADQAEDIVQETFIALGKNAHPFDPTLSSEANFIATIAHRKVIDALRRQARRPQVAPIDPEGSPDVFRDLDRVDDRDELAHAARLLRRLGQDQRSMLRLAMLKGLTHREIARDTGLPLSTVKSRIRRGLHRFRELLDATPGALRNTAPHRGYPAGTLGTAC